MQVSLFAFTNLFSFFFRIFRDNIWFKREYINDVIIKLFDSLISLQCVSQISKSTFVFLADQKILLSLFFFLSIFEIISSLFLLVGFDSFLGSLNSDRKKLLFYWKGAIYGSKQEKFFYLTPTLFNLLKPLDRTA